MGGGTERKGKGGRCEEENIGRGKGRRLNEKEWERIETRKIKKEREKCG